MPDNTMTKLEHLFSLRRFSDVVQRFFYVAHSILTLAYYPGRVSNVLGSEHIYGGGLPLPSPTNSLYLGSGRI